MEKPFRWIARIFLLQLATTASATLGIDLRPEFARLRQDLGDQGRQPSCAVFAIVNALEYSHFRQTGEIQPLSDAYVLWHLYNERQQNPAEALAALDGEDAGFAFDEVLAAIQEHGICRQEMMGYSLAGGSDRLSVPREGAKQDAQTRRFVAANPLRGDPSAMIAAIKEKLAQRQPVVIGARWPASAGLRRATAIDRQSPGGGSHAVLIIGLAPAERGNDANTRFIFLNSWGRDWGVNGFGSISQRYLEENLFAAFTVEFLRPDLLPRAWIR